MRVCARVCAYNCPQYREAVTLHSPGSRRRRAPWVLNPIPPFTLKALYRFVRVAAPS